MPRHTRGLLVLVLVGAAIAAFAGAALIGTDEPSRPDPAPPPPAAASPTGPTGPAGELADPHPARLRDDTPESVPDQMLEHAEDVEERVADEQDLPPGTKPLPVGGAQGYSCRRDLTTSGTGSRNGASVHSVKLHYAVARNRPGWGDVDGVGDYLERVGLAAHLVIDFEGNCEQKVDFARSAFTQIGFNSTSESIEIIAWGDETRAQWLAAPLIRKGILAAVVRDRLRARGLPLRFVDPVGCIDRLGYTDHNHLDCGNDHHDVAPNFPFDVFQRQLVAGPRATITSRDRARCSKVAAYRDRRRAGKPRTRAGRAAFTRRLRLVRGRGLRCVDGKPRRR